jgi:hypothetical protein
MTERAAHHLVDAVLLWVPVRQWVLTVLYRLRHQMAWNHGLSRAVLRVYTRAARRLRTRRPGVWHCGWADGRGHGAAARKRPIEVVRSASEGVNQKCVGALLDARSGCRHKRIVQPRDVIAVGVQIDQIIGVVVIIARVASRHIPRQKQVHGHRRI